MNERNVNFPIPDDADEVEGSGFVPRSAREKIEARLKAQTESPKGGFKQLAIDRRQFLKGSAIMGGVALAASGGIISLSGRKESEAMAAASVPEAFPQLESAAVVAGEKIEVANCAEAVIKILEAYGVDYIFWLTDDEISRIGDKLTTYVIEGKKPRPILALHEYGAMAMADGYAAASGKVGVCMYGANQGPMNSHGAIYNAYRGQKPVVIISALNRSTSLPYSGQYWVDPGDLVREYTKWTSHFPYPMNLTATLVHAFAVANTHPKGPVLISTAADVFANPMPDGIVKIPDVKRLTPPTPSVPSAETLETVADLLVHAENPIIVAGGYFGASEEAVTQLVGLAELLGAGVIESRRYITTFPWDHPLHIGFSTRPTKEADVVFVIEAGAPSVSATTKVIVLSVDPVMSHALAFGGRLRDTDVRMEGEPSATIPALMEVIMGNSVNSWAKFKETTAARAESWKKVHDEQRAEWKAKVEAERGKKPISVWQYSEEINKVMGDDTIVFGWSFNSRGTGATVLQTNEPRSFIYTLGGSHLGQSMYGAIGAACARPDKKIICCSGDLEWHMGHGFAALWTAAHENLPILFIIENNHLMATTKSGQMRNKGEGVTTGNWWAQEIFPPMSDYSQQAKGYGIHGACVKEPGDLGPALRTAMDWAQANKQPALVDVWTKALV